MLCVAGHVVFQLDERAVEAVAETIGAAVEAAGEAVDAVATLGNDMSPEERQQAQDTVVPAVIVTQIAGAVSALGASMSKPPSGGAPSSGSQSSGRTKGGKE